MLDTRTVTLFRGEYFYKRKILHNQVLVQGFGPSFGAKPI